MNGYPTSFAGLFGSRGDGAPVVERVEVPLIQRDYAQGRRGPVVDEIRAGFLDALLDAVGGGEPLSLDFVYGKVDDGTLHPLDGQQRLTTLFLLHWYLASAADRLTPQAPWTRFSYATRPSARLFCRRLAANALPHGVGTASAWITDQEWYLHVWRNDPTVQAMLVTVDALHEHIGQRTAGFDAEAAWERLTDPDRPAVSFHLLPLDELESDEELYIKMNSRGKPLTPFETFKARFEQDIAHSRRADELAHRLDGRWSDLLWPFHGGDDIVDDEFLRYIDYVTEICELLEGRVVTGRLGVRARDVFGARNARAEEHLDRLFQAFDRWQNADAVRAAFDGLLSTALPGDPAYDVRKVVLFGATGTNLFEQCCHLFDSQAEGNRAFTLQQSLLLHAVLLHRTLGTEDFPRRLRVLRNLVAASEDEVRRPNLPTLLADVEAVVVRGDLGAVSRLNANQVQDELLKQEFLADHPDLEEAVFRLEDHPLLRGTLTAFELDADRLPARAAAFEAAFTDNAHWPLLTGGMLATGDYQRQRPGSTGWQFGTGSAANDTVWRYVFTNGSRSALASTRAVLAAFLDGLAASGRAIDEHVSTLVEQWRRAREEDAAYDWRYYLVAYPSMREGASGIYFGVDGRMGYSMCMLRRRQLNSNYRDPVLLQVWRASGIGDLAEDPIFTGYETAPRWLRLVRSGVGVRSVEAGYALQWPANDALWRRFQGVCSRHGAVEPYGDDLLLRVPQADRGGDAVDTVDRVRLGTALVRDLVENGF